MKQYAPRGDDPPHPPAFGQMRQEPMKVYVIHENPDWYPPIAAAFETLGVPSEQWLLGARTSSIWTPSRRPGCSGPG